MKKKGHVKGVRMIFECSEIQPDTFLTFAERVERGEAQLSSGAVNIVPPDPLPRADGSIPLTVVSE